MKTFLWGALCAAAIVVPAQAATVPDFSFESPSVGTGFIYRPSVAGVTFTSNAGVQGNNSAWGFPAAPDGQQTAFIQSATDGTGSIAFSLTDLIVGQVYAVSFFAANRPGYQQNPVTISFGSQNLGTYTAGNAWSDFTTSTFLASSTAGTLTFAGTAFGSGDHDVGIDNVRVTAAAVPEPASWAMMIGGFGLLGTALRRKKAAVRFA